MDTVTSYRVYLFNGKEENVTAVTSIRVEDGFIYFNRGTQSEAAFNLQHITHYIRI